MSNAAYTPLSKSEEHTEDSLPTYPASPETHPGGSDGATYPPPAPAQETQLADNLCSYTLDLPILFHSERSVICERGTSKEDIIDKLSSTSPDVLARTALDKIIFEISVGDKWSEVLEPSFYDAVIKGRPSKIRISIRQTRREWWRTYGVVVICPIILMILFVVLILLLPNDRPRKITIE